MSIYASNLPLRVNKLVVRVCEFAELSYLHQATQINFLFEITVARALTGSAIC